MFNRLHLSALIVILLCASLTSAQKGSSVWDTKKSAWLLLTPIVGYGPSWIGHFAFEKNTPATWDHPLWSLRGDFKMVALALRGKMAAEVERVCGAATMSGDAGADHAAPAAG